MFNTIEEAIAFEKNKGDGAIPLFEYRAYENRLPSGEIEYEDRVWVKILNRGDSKNIQEGWLSPIWEKRFATQLKAFRDQVEAPVDGTALEVCPAFTKADVENCKKRHIRTVEELANFPDVELPKLRNGRKLKNAAEKFLQYRGGEVASLLKRIEELEKLLGKHTDNVPERAEGNGVSESVNAGGEQQSGREDDTGSGDESGEASGGGVSVDGADEGTRVHPSQRYTFL